MKDLFSKNKSTPGRNAFLAARVGSIGSSDVASLFPEETKYGCTRRLVYDKRGVEPDFKRTEAEEAILERGNVLEPIAAAKFVKDYEFDIRKIETHHGVVTGEKRHHKAAPDYVIENASFGHIAAFWPQLDFIEDPGPGSCEIKTANLFVFNKMIKDGLPMDYTLQLQWQMFVCGYKWGVYSIFEPGFWQLRSWPMLPSIPVVGEMVRRADAIMPTINDKALPLPEKLPAGDKRCFGCQWRQTCKGMAEKSSDGAPAISSDYVVDESFAESLSDLRRVREQMVKAEEIETMIEATIQEDMKAKKLSKVSTPSVGATISWEQRNGSARWDTKALTAESPDIGRKLHFCEWMQNDDESLALDLVTKFQKEHRKSPALADKFKKHGAPSMTFKVNFEAEDHKYEQ